MNPEKGPSLEVMDRSPSWIEEWKFVWPLKSKSAGLKQWYRLFFTMDVGSKSVIRML